MKKLSTLVAIILIACTSAFAIWHKDVKFQESSTTFKLLKSNDTELDLFASIAKADFFETTSKGGNFIKMTIPGFNTTKTVGSPELPVYSRLIEIPHGANISINIISKDVQRFKLNEEGFPYQLFPFQPSVSKSDDVAFLPFHINNDVYGQNAMLGNDMVTIDDLGMMRGVRMGRLNINHFKYNPVLNELEVYNNIEVEITFDNANLAKTNADKQKYYSPIFDNSFSKLINFKAVNSKELITIEPVKYVIISDRMFETPLVEFANWKRKKGFNVITAFTDEAAVGNTTTSIKNYLETMYNAATIGDPAPSFVLLVGDIQQVPSFSGTSGSHVSDLYYFTYDGANDIYPELYYGRFSATNIEELQPQIDKTLEYEQYLMPDPSFLDEVVLVAGVDASFAPTHGNGQINYGTDNYFNAAHGLSLHTYLYPASGSSASQIRSDIGSGASFANYTAHCGSNGWSDPSFNTGHIAAMQNANEYPLMIGNCCLSVKFDDSECFGEALLRAENKGALGYIGGSNSTYWDEDYWWGVGAGTVTVNPTYAQMGLGAFDGMFHENGEALADWYVTNGQIYQAGNLAVTEAGGSETYYWEIYHLMGDPSVSIYMGVPNALVANHLNAIPVGSSSITVTTEEHAYVALSVNNELIAAKMADASGMAVINFPALTTVGSIDIVATKQDRAPYISTISVISSNAPFVVCSSYEIDDSNGNNNTYSDYSENILLNVSLNNLGLIDANDVYAVISTNDTSITILNDSVVGGFIANSSTIVLNSAFELQVGDYIEDEHQVLFDIAITDANGTTWMSNISMPIYAPKLNIENISFDDAVGGNGNGRLDPGEVVNITFDALNEGHCPASSTIAALTTASPFIQVVGNPVVIAALDVNTPETVHATIVIDPNIPLMTVVELDFNLAAGYYTASKSKEQNVGQIAEDWESETFTTYDWDNTGANPWVITSATQVDGIYSAASADIGDSETSELEISVNVATADTISFYFKVSCEEQGWSFYDFLEFKIDNSSKGKWAGEVAWNKVSYPISAGQHTLKWIYEKDSYQIGGEDKAWIDQIIFPNIGSASQNTPPTIDTQADTLTEKYEVYTYIVGATDLDGDNITLTCIQKPDFLTFTDDGLGAGTLTGTPASTDDGVYPVIISAFDGTSYSPQYYDLHVVAPSYISEFDQQIAVDVYPNPVVENAEVQIQISEASSISMKLVNVLGEELQTISLNEMVPAGLTTKKIDMKNFESGVYFIHMNINSTKHVVQIVKN